jgi:hypothetical protein
MFRTYSRVLIKQNLAYIVCLVLLLILSVGITFFFVDQIKQVKDNADQLSQEVSSLKANKVMLDKITGENASQLTNDLQIINSLIPNSEDYFSIIYALDRLSQQTKFVINSYNINVAASNSEKLALTVSGVGDPTAFINFLKSYNVGGGRLITAEKIEIDAAQQGSVKLQLSFYSKQALGNTPGQVPNIEKTTAQLNLIKSKLNFDFAPDQTATESATEPYRTKDNPF